LRACAESNPAVVRIYRCWLFSVVFKVLPIIDWDNRTVYQYLQKHGLKYHPLWDQGYLSVGDTHTTRKWEPGMAEEETRFFG
jgi:phosphoadenosine phosphosulfate reductase